MGRSCRKPSSSTCRLNHLPIQFSRNCASGRGTNLPLIDAEVGALLRVLATADRRHAHPRDRDRHRLLGNLARRRPAGRRDAADDGSEPERAKQARDNFARAGLADRANVIVGDAQLMLAKVSGPFDLIFQDGDKRQYAPMLDRLVALLRPGGLLVTDNVLWNGEVVPGFVAAPQQDPEETRAIADYNERLSAHPQLLTASCRCGTASRFR